MSKIGKHKEKLVRCLVALMLAEGYLETYKRRKNIHHQSWKDEAMDAIKKAQKKVKAMLDTY